MNGAVTYYANTSIMQTRSEAKRIIIFATNSLIRPTS